jgi:acetoin utilization deacetylase AcuC-like enzyme
MLAAYITHPDCARHDMGPDHPECPQRLGAIHDQLLMKGLLDLMVPYDAPLATPEQLGRAHAALYVQELMAKSPNEGIVQVDPDTAMGPYTLRAALRAAGAVIEATDLILSGQVGTAFWAGACGPDRLRRAPWQWQRRHLSG